MIKLPIFYLVLYISLHASIGAICGFLYCYGNEIIKRGRVFYYRAWIAFSVGISLCLFFVYKIGAIDHNYDVDDIHKYFSIVTVGAPFFVIKWICNKYLKEDRSP